MKCSCGLTLLLLITVLCQLKRRCVAQLDITLQSSAPSHNGSFTKYTDSSWFSTHYANVPDHIVGHIQEPIPSNACLHIEPLRFDTQNGTWFALVDDYPSCGSEMVVNVRNAGYKLIITASHNDSHRSLSHKLVDTDFPIIVVKEYYANYLRTTALSNLTSDPITVHIDSQLLTPVLIITLSLFSVLCCCCTSCFVICACCCCCRSDEDFERRLQRVDDRRRDFEHQQRRDRLARHELIQSILRQLQDLQLDLRLQVPLGEEATRQLPMREYRVGQEVCEACAICVDDFVADEMVRVLPCNHIFHSQCIDEWLTNHSSLCPLCKKEVSRQRGLSPGNIQSDMEDTEDTNSITSSSDRLLLSTPRGVQGSGSYPTYGSV